MNQQLRRLVALKPHTNGAHPFSSSSKTRASLSPVSTRTLLDTCQKRRKQPST